ncbi:LamG domain-containing protein [Riemerella columbina]|uniref:LamG domain-containing protein n=1 Tax=Riemerella columbina TaxID=103810 RepID=UPI00266EA2B1|nr:LamG domain-containing protein [Riemerella columbina]WKS94880.1 LamG domain-containing protein [Riemerella columbina]
MNRTIIKTLSLWAILGTVWSCQDLDRPDLGDYPKDEINLPDGDLRFFVPFDKSSDILRFQFAEELSGYPAFTPDKSIESQEGIKEKAYKGSLKGYLEYISPNDFAEKAQSFTVSYWMKHAPTTTNAEFVFSIPSSIEHWTKSTMLLMNESSARGIAVKMILVDKDKRDTWLTWEGANAIPADGFFDEKWHHCALVYDAATSELTFYKDGVQMGTPKKWGTHGGVDMDASKVTQFRLGGPAGSDAWMKPWGGGLDQFRLYTKALSSAEIAQLYNNKD